MPIFYNFLKIFILYFLQYLGQTVTNCHQLKMKVDNFYGTYVHVRTNYSQCRHAELVSVSSALKAL